MSFAGEGEGERKGLKVDLQPLKADLQRRKEQLLGATFFCCFVQGFKEVMAQSSKAAGRGQRRGRNVSSHGPSSTNISLSAGGSAPSVSSEAIGASMPSINLVEKK